METQSPQQQADARLAGMTSAQLEAIRHVDGPLLILAGPGSGKTRVVTHRIAHLLSVGVGPEQILALTFTNKAADEMRQRLAQLAPDAPLWIGTFHRFCAQLLRRSASLIGLSPNFSIYDVEDARRLMADAVAEARADLSHVKLDQIGREISHAKNELISAENYQPRPGRVLGGIVQRVYPIYSRLLLQANAVDFDDLLLHVASLLRENPELRAMLDEQYRYILVDEYQDTNFAQYAIVRAMSRDYPNLAVTGDPDQSIYGWRGASVENILDFERDFPAVHVVRLEQNYRSTQRILRVADQLISCNTQRKHKSLLTDNPEGAAVRLVVYPTSQDEAAHVAARIADDLRHGRRRPRDFAIFYRVNALSRAFEHALREAHVPLQIVRGVEFYQRREVKDLLAYLHLINNPSSDVALLRIINVPLRKIGKTTVARLAAFARQQRWPLLEAARHAADIETLSKAARNALAAFVALQDQLGRLVDQPVEAILGYVLEQTGYEQWLAETEKDTDRLSNVKELLSACREFDATHPEDHRLETYLEQCALVNDSDDLDIESDRVSLMTLHAAKGLEFPVVYIAGVEQGLIPHERNKDDPRRIEEERRLLFVGITRAEEELQLSTARYRLFQGVRRMTVPSPFLVELPRDDMEIVEPIPMGFRSDRSHALGDAYDTEFYPDDPPADELEFAEESTNRETDLTRPAAAKPPARELPPAARVLTAAALMGAAAEPRPRTPVDVFAQGMIVSHPERGTGKIIALSGEGTKRAATVQFFHEQRPCKFMLAFSDLRPVAPG